MEFEHVVQRIRAEFNEMPGLRLTLRQAVRLWGIEEPTCKAVIQELVNSKFLQHTSCGTAVTRLSH